MTHEEALQIVKPFYDAFATGSLTLLESAFHPDWVDQTLPANRPPGLAGMGAALQLLRNILPDLTATIQDLRVDDDMILVRILFEGTNHGGLPGIPGDGKRVTFLAFDWHRVVERRIRESWHLEDNLSLMIQLGAVPPIG